MTLLSNLYAPPLVTMPDAWTMTVKINDSGSDDPGFLISGPGNLAFDRRGYAWVTNNTIQGTPCSGRFNLVFKPNGQPADGRNGTPRSPLTGGGVLGGGFGVTVDPRGSAWFGNFGWGNSHDCTPDPIPSADGNGSISRFTLSGAPMSQPNGYQGGARQGAGTRRQIPMVISGSRASATTPYMYSNAAIRISPCCVHPYARSRSVRCCSCHRRNHLGILHRWTALRRIPQEYCQIRARQWNVASSSFCASCPRHMD